MKERLKIVLVLFALTPFLAGGGGFSGAGFTTILPAAVNAHIVVDPHNTLGQTSEPANTRTATGRQASIRVTRGAASASAFFTVPSDFAFTVNGCNTTQGVMDQRFVSVPNVRHVPLNAFVPGTVLADLLSKVGVTSFADGGNAVITSTDHASCTPPLDGSHTGANGPGILSFHARIHLVN
jgi:hypothetical protein